MADKCHTDEGTSHTGYTDTGQTGTNPNTGTQYKIYRCDCGQDTMEVYN